MNGTKGALPSRDTTTERDVRSRHGAATNRDRLSLSHIHSERRRMSSDKIIKEIVATSKAEWHRKTVDSGGVS